MNDHDSNAHGGRAAFVTDAAVALPASVRDHGLRCGCALHARRRFSSLLATGGVAAAAPAWAQQTAPRAARRPDAECKVSWTAGAVSAAQIEQGASQQYRQMLAQAQQQRALAPIDHPQMQRLRYIAQRIVPFTNDCNPNAAKWRWEVNLIGSDQLNAFCMPGGKIAFYYGILDRLKLTDDEVAQIMGHEISHALLEHARERIGKTSLTRGALEIGAVLLGLGDLGRVAAGVGGQLLSLKFSRSDESEADALGMLLAARAGYDPKAGVTLWQKMMAANKGAPPQWLSTHPSGASRIQDLTARQSRVQPEFAAAAKPDQRFGPPKGIQG